MMSVRNEDKRLSFIVQAFYKMTRDYSAEKSSKLSVPTTPDKV